MRRLNIFIVDDDRDFAESMAEALEWQGHTMTVAFSGEEAIQRFKEHNFDLTFMDVKLPGMNGVESFLEIRALKPQARVVMMTGYSVEQLLDKATRSGAWNVLHKPLKMERVLAMVEQVKPDGILIADDDPDFVAGIHDVLDKAGYTVFIAHNGQEALDTVRNNGIDVLILDLRMPVLNGLDCYTQLRKSGHIIPTIIVTAYQEEENETINTLNGLSTIGVLTKPFNPTKLLEAVQHLTSKEEPTGDDYT